METEESNTEVLNLHTAVECLQYESQHFGFHPRTFLDMVYNIFYENTTNSLFQAKQYLIQEFKDVVPPSLIKLQTDVILKKTVEQMEKSMDKLEIYLNKEVFSIENHVIFPEDEVHIKNPVTKEEDEKLDLDIEELRQKILQEKAKRASLKQKISEQQELKKTLYTLQRKFESLLDVSYQEDVTPENIQSMYSDFAELSKFPLLPL